MTMYLIFERLSVNACTNMAYRYFLLLFAICNCACSDSGTERNDSKIEKREEWVTITPVNYLDFEFAKVVAFATIDPFDDAELVLKSSIGMSAFRDTVSMTLNLKQTEELIEVLSGKRRKPVLKGQEDLVADCFHPRHNIVFLNEKEEVIHFVSVCFECGNTRESKNHLADMENLYTFFDGIGLKVFDTPEEHRQFYSSY